MADTFAVEFLRIYDRKIMSGEITFSQSGISKEDFSRLCTEEDFVISSENLETICRRMKLTDSERSLLFSYTSDTAEEK